MFHRFFYKETGKRKVMMKSSDEKALSVDKIMILNHRD